MTEYGFLPRKKGFGTKSIHGGGEPEQWGPAWDLTPPIHIAATYKYEAVGKSHNGYSYGRSGNPTRTALEECLAKLHDAIYSLTFSSGTAAAVNITHLLNAGDHIVIVDELYGGISRYFSTVATRMNITITYIDATNLENVKKSIKSNTKLVWLETPSNPLLKIIDLKEISRIVHEISPEVIVAVDNTFMTSYFQKPLEFGADLTMASLTKYYNGHNDVIMGAIFMNRDDLYKDLRYLQNTLGATPSPLDCNYVIRSLKTLPIRMEKHMKNGIAVANYLENHPNIKKVLHPVLKSHKQYDLARKQSYGHSGMLSFYLKGGEKEARTFLENLKIFRLATSLGDVGSLVNMPILMTDLPEHQMKDPEVINYSLVRMSVGLEDEDDLIEDLEQALKIAFRN